jgi:membrane protein YdbS with pleckstrin-like domain
VILQATVGITQYFTPGLYGGEDNAKALYKYHRVWGYITLVMMLATVCAATQTSFNVNVLQMQLWAIVAAAVVVLVGVVPRIRLSKFGWLAGKS